LVLEYYLTRILYYLNLCIYVLIRFEEGYGVEGEDAKLQPEQEGATTGKSTFSLPQQRTTTGSGARGGAGGVRQGEVENQEVGPSMVAPRGQVGWAHEG
jgi:hypothetical protein